MENISDALAQLDKRSRELRGEKVLIKEESLFKQSEIEHARMMYNALRHYRYVTPTLGTWTTT